MSQILISKKNQNIQLDSATEHILLTEEQLNMVHFSDESKFNLFVSNGKRFVRRKNGERLSPQCVKKIEIWMRGIMVWGIISLAGVGPIAHFRSNINARVYKLLFHLLFFLIYNKGELKLQCALRQSKNCVKFS